MRAVWSLWTEPLARHLDAIWLSSRSCLLALALSVELARRHFLHTVLCTDTRGARILVDGIGLEFSEVYTDLDKLSGYDPAWWSLGKMVAYRLQQEPFVHLDSDVFLWSPLPSRCFDADIFAQNPEPFVVGEGAWYIPAHFEDVIRTARGGWLPEEWKWYRTHYVDKQRAICCGIFGGCNLDFIHWYADLARRIVDHPANAVVLSGLRFKARHMAMVEQYLLEICLTYRNVYGASSGERPLHVEFLFEDPADAHVRAAQAGYTHLIADAKLNPDACTRLARRLAEGWPETYERIEKYLADRGRENIFVL